jgi:hypothetical protein
MKLVMAVAAAALLGACAPKSFSLEGKDAEQMTKDEAQCRSQVRAQAETQRNLEDQRRDVFAGERERYGGPDLYVTMDNEGYKNNMARLTARCMEARGWAPKGGNSWWQRNSTFNTPLGGGK